MSLLAAEQVLPQSKAIILEICRSILAVYEHTEKQCPSICTTTQDGQYEIFHVPKELLSIQLCNYKTFILISPLFVKTDLMHLILEHKQEYHD